MAQKVNIILVDDIDGSEAAETISFGLDGATYEIDLNAEHAEQLREALAPWVGHARKLTSRRGGSGRRQNASSGSSGSSGPTPAEMREWGRKNGFEVSERGRVPTELRIAYQNAH